MLDAAWLIPASRSPAPASTCCSAAGSARPRGGWPPGSSPPAFAVGVAVLFELVALPAEERSHVVRPVRLDLGRGVCRSGVNLLLDPLSMTMTLVVTGVGSLIHLYAIGYMEHEPRFGRFFAYLNLFVFFMLMLVLADNFLVLYLGWEGVGLCSYLLIGFWYERPSASSAAKKAFITTRIGDAAMMLGIVLIFVHLGSLDFGEVLGLAAAGLSNGAATAIALLLLAGAIGKSAQFPLHVWLPDAMEGPTPVSALIHAATMVTAGVYLMVRSHALFEASEMALTVVLVVGLVSAIYAALASIGQLDIKRSLAYSTMSQIGFMFFAAGMGFYAGAMLLLVCHAFYKALLFLTSGNVMHGLEDETDLRKMGGLRREMPVSAAWFAIGALSLAGIPPLAGFFAKDHIVGFASTAAGSSAWVLASAGAFLSALYIVRPLFLAFFGPKRHEGDAHEARALMQAPLAVLALLSVVGGAALGLTAEGGRLERFLEPAIGVAEHGHGALSEAILIAVSVVLALLAVGLAYWIWASGRVDWQAFPERQPELAGWLSNAFYLNALYAWLVRRPGSAFGRALTVVDDRVIDGAVNEVGRDVGRASRLAPVIQRGFVRSYALAFLLGAAALLLYLGVRA